MNISFRNLKIEDVPYKLKRKYDVILFSNVLDYMSDSFGKYWNYGKLMQFDESVQEICNDGAFVFYHYVNQLRHGKIVYCDRPLFHDSSVFLNDLDNSSGIRLVPISKSVYTDGVVLKKVKK